MVLIINNVCSLPARRCRATDVLCPSVPRVRFPFGFSAFHGPHFHDVKDAIHTEHGATFEAPRCKSACKGTTFCKSGNHFPRFFETFSRNLYLCGRKVPICNMTLYNEYGIWLKNQLGVKSQKISLNASFTCPNRDGRVGTGGCTYCNNQTFNPDYCITTKSITQQLEEGKQFFARKYPDMKYLAYFQAYTNTYDSLPNLIAKYEEALSVPDVIGLVIGTRPDCMPDALLDYLEDLNQRTFLVVEYGIESVYDATLQRINRGHTHAQTVDAIQRTAARDIRTGAHLILGLPGEGREAILAEADILSSLPLTTLKLHQLQLIRGTRMAEEYEQNPSDFHLFTPDEYIDLVIDFIERLRPDLVLERFVSQSPSSFLAIPGWGLKNHEFVDRLRLRMTQRQTHQGRLHSLPFNL